MKRCTIAALATVVLGASQLAAQDLRRGIELGIDGILGTASSAGQSTTFLSLPMTVAPNSFLPALRVGMPVATNVHVEPAVAVAYNSSSGFSSTNIILDVGWLIDLNTPKEKAQWFVRPLVGLRMASFSGAGGNSDAAPEIGAGAGVRLPMTDRLAARFEARWESMAGGNNLPEQKIFGLLFGLSFFP